MGYLGRCCCFFLAFNLKNLRGCEYYMSEQGGVVIRGVFFSLLIPACFTRTVNQVTNDSNRLLRLVGAFAFPFRQLLILSSNTSSSSLLSSILFHTIYIYIYSLALLNSVIQYFFPFFFITFAIPNALFFDFLYFFICCCSCAGL